VDTWRPGDPPPVDDDGTRLLFKEQFAALAGLQETTIRWALAASKTARRRRQPMDFPQPRRYIRRVTPKADGQPLTARTPLWRLDAALGYALRPAARKATREAAQAFTALAPEAQQAYLDETLLQPARAEAG